MAILAPSSTRVAPGGRIVIPARFRKALGIKPGDKVVLQLEEDGLRVYSQAQALRRLQDRVALSVPPGTSLVKELIRERRDEARL